MRFLPEWIVSSTSECVFVEPLGSSFARSALHRTVLKLDTVKHALDHGRGDLPAHLRNVGLLDPEARVGELVREFAVVREDEQAARVGVEAADVVEPVFDLVGEFAEVWPAPARRS